MGNDHQYQVPCTCVASIVANKSNYSFKAVMRWLWVTWSPACAQAGQSTITNISLVSQLVQEMMYFCTKLRWLAFRMAMEWWLVIHFSSRNNVNRYGCCWTLLLVFWRACEVSLLTSQFNFIGHGRLWYWTPPPPSDPGGISRDTEWGTCDALPRWSWLNWVSHNPEAGLLKDLGLVVKV